MRQVQGALVALLMVLTVAPLRAQEVISRPNTTPYSAPPTSPYLNMLRGGNPAVNYYGLVRPQVDSQRAIQQMQQQGTASPPSTGLTMEAIPNSGHTVQFMNFSHYFNNNIGSGLTGGRMVGPANVRR